MSVKEYFSLLFKCLFKYYSFEKEVEKWGKSKRLKTVLWANLYNGVLTCILVCIAWVGCNFFHVPFYIKEALLGDVFGVIIGAVVVGGGVYRSINAKWIVFGVVIGVVTAVASGGVFGGVYGDVFAANSSVFVGVVSGVYGGVTFGVVFTIFFVIDRVIGRVIYRGALYGVLYGVFCGVSVSLREGVEQGFIFGSSITISFIITYLLVTGRFYYYLYAPLYKMKNPLWWDENIGIAVPYLPQMLRGYAKTKDFDKTIEFTKFLIEERPVQRKTAQKGLTLIALDKMKGFNKLEDVQELKTSLSFMPSAEWFSEYFEDGDNYLSNYNDEYQKYLSISNDLLKTNQELNYANRVAVYERTRVKLLDYRKAANLSNSPFAKEFGEIADSWQKILNNTIEDLRASGKLPLPNPYTLGKAIQADSELFLGRRDLIQKIETETLREGAATALLFIGNRRTGKSSTLNNLQRFVQSSLRTVFADLQDAEVNSSIEDFCEALTERIAKSLQIQQPESIRDLATFTKWLKQRDEELIKSKRYLLICIDEYERLEGLISRGKLTELPNTLRYWIQHLQHVVFLLAGSHEPAELDGIDWTDYLINVRNVPISYLEYDAAMQLVTAPVPHFDLTWENDDLPVQLVHRLGRQPYLLQCAMWNLVEILNNKGIKHATQADIEKALEKVMDGDAANHFNNFWKTEMKDDSRQILSNLAKGTQPTEGSVLNLLKRKEIVAFVNGQYVFCVPLLKEWIQRNVD